MPSQKVFCEYSQGDLMQKFRHKCCVLCIVGLGGIAILVLNNNYLLRFLQGLLIECSIRVFKSFSFIRFCKYQAFVFNSIIFWFQKSF